jgi:hypothetical protein
VIEVVAGVVTAQAELAPVAFEVRALIITSLLERIMSCYEESLRSRLPPPTRASPWCASLSTSPACLHQQGLTKL